MRIYRLSFITPGIHAEFYSGKASTPNALRDISQQLVDRGFYVRLQVLDLDGQVQYSLPIEEAVWEAIGA